MPKYWFKPKRYGYGFYPITWQGWFSLIVFIGLIFLFAKFNDFFNNQVSWKQGLCFILGVIILSLIFTLIFKDRVEGKLQWRWGKEK